MNEYLIRKAVAADIPFLADAIIAAEKGNTDKLSFSTLFNLSEKQVREYFISMLQEDVDGCEFSLSTYLVCEYNSAPVASMGAWIECFGNTLPSKILKSNLINFTFCKESIAFLKSKSEIIKDILAEREPMTLQYEYAYTSPDHRGARLADSLLKKHEELALSVYPGIKKFQTQIFKINSPSLKFVEARGFKIAKSFKSNNKQISDYLPCDEKYIMEKHLTNL